MAFGEHRDAAAASAPVRCAVLTISDTRTSATDRGGPRVRELLESFGHAIHESAIVPDEPADIRAAISRWLAGDEIDAIITTGGTGISMRDGTVEVVRTFIELELAGFGELFRMLSWEQVGSAAMLSRAMGGVAARPGRSLREDPGVLIFALPGSVKAIELAITRLIGPELAHLAWERQKHKNPTR